MFQGPGTTGTRPNRRFGVLRWDEYDMTVAAWLHQDPALELSAGAPRIHKMQFNTLAQIHLGQKKGTRCVEMARRQESGPTGTEIHTQEVHTGNIVRR